MQGVSRKMTVFKICIVFENTICVTKTAIFLETPCRYLYFQALPSATGHIAARGSSRVVLTWQRPKAIKTWENVGTPKLLLVTRFLDSTGIVQDTTSTRLIAYMDPSSTCPADNPPIEQLMLDALPKSTGNYFIYAFFVFVFLWALYLVYNS
uniref:Uncharacterized protein n=1 Tax=Panagrolaimus sp. ES5 TaxID=591445 RepID=A0AC34F3W0_9BILA